MVLEKYGPPIARKTRHMLQTDTKKSISSPCSSKKVKELCRDNIGIHNRP